MKTLLSFSTTKFAIKSLSTVSTPKKFKYDLVVLGGTIAGLAAAKEASTLGATVAVIDSTNLHSFYMGCLSRKLMHRAAVLGEAIYEAKTYGWRLAEHPVSYDWPSLSEAMQYHIKSVQNSTIQDLKEKHVDYVSDERSQLSTTHNLSSEYFLVGLQCRTEAPYIPGAAEYGVLSEDLIKMCRPPGRTLVVGGGRYGLECAGVLNVLGYDTTVMVRSIPLKKYDQQMAGMVVAEMLSKGVKFLIGCSPKSVTKLTNDKLEISWINPENTNSKAEFDTVVFATGRKSIPGQINRVDSQTFTIEEDSMKNNVQEGKLLARKLFAGSIQEINYAYVPTTIFTPLEYSFVGLSEEEALNQYNDEDIEVYHTYYKPPEFCVAKKNVANCYLKVVSLRQGEQNVLGLHFLGPHAEEITQGFSVAMKCNLTVNKLKNTVGIHPTVAEEFTKVCITKRSGENPCPASCCS